MTTPQVHLAMLGLGLLAFFLITGFRSSRKSSSRQHRRRWWLGIIAAAAVILSPLTQFWRATFNGVDLLTQSLLFSALSLLCLLLFALLLTPYRAMRRYFKKRRRHGDYVLSSNDAGLTAIATDSNSSRALGNTASESIENADSGDALYNTHSTDKSLTETINESGQIKTEEELSNPAFSDTNASENNARGDNARGDNARRDIDQVNTKKLDATNIESVVPLHRKTDGTHQLDESLSRTSAANDKISTVKNQSDTSNNAIRNASVLEDYHHIDDTLRLDELVDDTLRLDELADDTLRLDELLPKDEMPANSERQTDEQQAHDEHNTAAINANQSDELQAGAENALLAEEQLDSASIPSKDESLDLSETEHLYSEIRSQQPDVELPDDKELRDANQASAMDDVYLDTSLLTGDHSEVGAKQASDSQTAEIEEADVIHNDIDLGANEADLEFGNDLTGEYAHPADEYELSEDAIAQAAEQAAKYTTAQPHATESLADQTQAPLEEQENIDYNDDFTATEMVEPQTLTEAMDAAMLTAQSVESQVVSLEESIAQLDELRDASVNTAHSNVEQQNVAIQQTNVLLTCEDEARRAAESVIEAQTALLARAKEQQAEVDALLKQERQHLGLLKGEVERSRKMARTAALLARKAAVAQQEIRSVAKREQTARLKSEESTRKAVTIARNAINALAEEERKRDLTQH